MRSLGAGLPLEENLRRLAPVPLLFAPGTVWNYSLSTDVLGAVIGTITGMALDDAVSRLATSPLALTDRDFEVVALARLAAAYADGILRPRRMNDDDLIPTIPELARGAMAPGRAFDSDAFPSGGAGMVGTAGDT